MMNDEQIFLANAYLDGEVTDEERRLAEADPAVMAEVETLRALQRQVRSVDPPSAAARDAAIAAAMTEFTIGTAPSPPVTATSPPPTIVPFRPRPAYSRYLAIAAAIVTIGVLGVVVTNLPAGDDDDAASDIPAAEPAAEESAGGDVSERTFVEDDVAQEVAEDEAMVAAADTEAAEMVDDDSGGTADEPAAEEPAAEEPPSEPTTGSDDGSLGDPADDLATDLIAGRTSGMPITSDEELGLFGASLLALIEAEALPPTPETSCEPIVLDVAYIVFDDIVTEVYVGVDPQRSVVIAIEPDTCDVVREAPLPG